MRTLAGSDGTAASAAAGAHEVAGSRGAQAWWPLALLLLLAAAVRLSTIGLQSFWFDEAFTPVHVIHPSIVGTMKTMSHTENSPPLWYVCIWAWTRIFGTGVVAMRMLSALAGIALVAVAWGIGDELAGRRAAIAAAALTAFNPLLVWYSQEARTYELFALTAALAILCFLRAEREPTGRRMAAFALAGSLALLSHYFAVFLLVPMSLWLLRKRERWKAALPAVAAIGLVGLALIPLLISQGGHGTQWIGQWALRSRLEAIPQYYLTGESGAPLGHGVELLIALPILAGLAYGLRRGLQERERQGALLALALACCGILIPILFVMIGEDFLAPRNLIAAMVPLTALLAVILAASATGRVGAVLTAAAAIAFLAICVDVDLSPRLQRGDWSGVAAALQSPSGSRVIATMHLGSAPLEYYVGGLRGLHSSASVRVREIDEVAYPPLLSTAGKPPSPAFHLASRVDVNGLYVYRFRATSPQVVSVESLRHDGLTSEYSDVLGGPERA